jgi:tRNA pseudouridine55 synthase
VLEGLLLVDKDAGCTSHDVVQRARRILRQKRIGHCGTLDPDATGLLLLTLGRATRLTRFLIRAPKVYEGVVRLGSTTDTYDASGRVVSEAPVPAFDDGALAAAMASLEGTYEQTPPPYCAKKVNGVRYYEIARRGEEVPEFSKEVTVFEFRAGAGVTADTIPFRLACSSGTYARTLAHELGARLGCGGHLSALRRTRIGHFDLAQALTLDELARRMEAGGDLGEGAIGFDRIPLPFPEAAADSQQERRIVHGQSILLREIAGEEGDWVKLTNDRAEFIAVGTVVERIGGAVGVVQPRIVFK